jgi:hypothetical protein
VRRRSVRRAARARFVDTVTRPSLQMSPIEQPLDRPAGVGMLRDLVTSDSGRWPSRRAFPATPSTRGRTTRSARLRSELWRREPTIPRGPGDAPLGTGRSAGRPESSLRGGAGVSRARLSQSVSPSERGEAWLPRHLGISETASPAPFPTQSLVCTSVGWCHRAFSPHPCARRHERRQPVVRPGRSIAVPQLTLARSTMWLPPGVLRIRVEATTLDAAHNRPATRMSRRLPTAKGGPDDHRALVRSPQ